MVNVFAISKMVNGIELYLYINQDDSRLQSFTWCNDIDNSTSFLKISTARVHQNAIIAVGKGLGFDLDLQIVRVKQTNEVLCIVEESTLDLLDPPKESVDETPDDESDQ